MTLCGQWAQRFSWRSVLCRCLGLALLPLLSLCIAACARPPTPTVTPAPSPAKRDGGASPTVLATLQVAKLVDAKEATPGTVLRYILVVMNDMMVGADPGTKVTVMDRLPPELELVPDSLSTGAVYDLATRTITWQGEVPRGGSIQVLFKARMTAAAANWRSIINVMQVTDAFGRQRETSAQTQVLLPAATDTPLPPTVTPTPRPAPQSGTAGPATVTPTPPPPPTTLPTPQSSVPYVKCLVITPDEPPVYYLVVGDALYRSANRGLTWSADTLQGVPEGALVSVVAVDYRHPQTMYLGTDKGLFRREGQGEPWGLVNTLRVSALAVDLENADVLWAGIGWDTAMRSVIVKSSDRGRTWSKADYGVEIGYSSAWVDAILINPKNPNIIWAHVRPGARHDWPPGLVFRGGRDGTWERLALGAPFDLGSDPWKSQEICFVSGLAYDPNLNALYVGCDISWFNGEKLTYRLLRSLNADAPNSADVRWELLAELGTAPNISTNSVRPLAVDAREPKSLFVFLDVTQEVGQPRFKLVVSHDDGKTWQEMALQGLPGG